MKQEILQCSLVFSDNSSDNADNSVAAERKELSSNENNENWNETTVEQIKYYHVTGKYPSDEWTSVKKRNFRRRAQQFTVKDGNLYYKDKKDASHRLAIASSEEKNQIFMVKI